MWWLVEEIVYKFSGYGLIREIWNCVVGSFGGSFFVCVCMNVCMSVDKFKF